MGQDIIKSLGLDKAISVYPIQKDIMETQSVILHQVQEFGIDAVYFNTDENGNSFPAIFLKKVNSFSEEVLKSITDTHKKAWNYKKVLFLYVYSDTEIRIYNCIDYPLFITQNNFNYEKELCKLEIERYKFSDIDKLKVLNQLFSSIAIDTGIIWTSEDALFIREKINIQRRVDKYLVESLVNTSENLKNQGLKIDFIHKIILRSLFLLYLEDRGATDAKFYGQIKNKATSYFDILEDVKATHQLYQKLEEHFKGNIFGLDIEENISVNQLQLIKKCFISGNENTPQISLFENWRLFDFSIIQIELISEIYENFLFKTDPELKKKTGTYYTPPTLVELILNEKLPINKAETNYNIKILDPSCGSGIFLVESFKRLVKRYENHHNQKLSDFDTLKELLINNIFGIELHPQAIKVAAFSLYLALVDNLNPKTIWLNKKHNLPYLINNLSDKSLKEQGYNLFCRDTIKKNEDIENIPFNLIIGNPPFGTTDLSDVIHDYCNTHNFAKEMVLPFLHKAIKLAPNGEIALIFNTKILTNTEGTYQNFRRWLFNECYVERIYNFSILRKAKKNFGGQLFSDAVGPISIIFYKKVPPNKPSDKIIYYAPKTYIKSNIIEGMNIDFSDMRYLPREECIKPDTKIWKIAMWGGINDWELVNSIDSKYKNLKSVFSKENNTKWKYATGLNADSTKLDFVPDKIIDTRKIDRYFSSDSATYTNNKIYRKIDEKLFQPPFIVIKQAQANKQIAASYIDYQAYCLSSAYVINGDVDDNFKKALIGVINSTFTKYYLFMVASSWGIERERVSFEELLSIPFLLLDEEKVSRISKLVSTIINIKKLPISEFKSFSIKELESKIDNVIYDILNLSPADISTIHDTLNYNLDLFENQEKSKALHAVSQKQIIQYGDKISQELNDFFDGEDLWLNYTIYSINKFTPLMMIKLTFNNTIKEHIISKESISEELKKMDRYLWEKQSTNLYFRKKLNYKTENDIYIIRPNQRRFWSESMALEDASELILEILNGN